MNHLSRLKPLLRWILLGVVLAFLAKALGDNWHNVASVRITAARWRQLAIATGVTLLAHICAGWVWSRMLRHDFRQPVQTGRLVGAYLQTNVAKYLPGNIWHYYGRISAATKAGADLETATVSVVLEPLLMAASALLVALLSGQAIATRYGSWLVLVQWCILIATLLAIQPRRLNPIIRRLAHLKQKALPPVESVTLPAKLTHYPLAALIGTVAFLVLRAAGFLLTLLAVTPLHMNQVPALISGFSVAWLLGLVVPGAPGGLGIFEATAIALLGHLFSPGILLTAVALYRLVSVAAEAIGAGCAWLTQQIKLEG